MRKLGGFGLAIATSGCLSDLESEMLFDGKTTIFDGFIDEERVKFELYGPKSCTNKSYCQITVTNDDGTMEFYDNNSNGLDYYSLVRPDGTWEDRGAANIDCYLFDSGIPLFESDKKLFRDYLDKINDVLTPEQREELNEWK